MKRAYRKRRYHRDIPLKKRRFMDNDGYGYDWKKIVYWNHVYGGLELRDLRKLRTLRINQFISPYMGGQIARIQ